VLDQAVVGVAGVLVLVALVFTALAPVYPTRGKAAKEFADRLVPPPAAAASPKPGAGGTPTTGADQLPAALIGTWSGVVTQNNPSTNFHTSYAVTLVLHGGTVGNVVGTSSYPSIPCTGDLLLDRGGSEVMVTEHIVSGTHSCSDTPLSLKLDGSGNLVYHFADSGDGTGDGVLNKQR